MDIGLSRGPAIFRSPVPAQTAQEHAVQLRQGGEAEGLSDGDRPAAASQKALDARGPHEVGADPTKSEAGKDAKGSDESKDAGGLKDTQDLSEDEKRQVESLQRRDRAVRAHEAAHLAAAGAYAAGGPSYTTQQGPDGRSYAIGGEVPIDMSAERTPEATLRKAQTVRAAAMAPADPSGADKAIAAAASQMAEAAQAQMAEEAAAAVEELAANAEEQAATRPEPPASDEKDAGPNASSTEGFAALRDEVNESAPTESKQVAKNKRGQISKAYVAAAQTPARATLRCASCASFH